MTGTMLATPVAEVIDLGKRERMYPRDWPGAESEQLTLPLRLPERHRRRAPVPEALVRQLLRWKRDRD